jgi:crotonobetainyl-CoA:carnitine CoA-transferase CaiB-like acyl-CoA transferase
MLYTPSCGDGLLTDRGQANQILDGIRVVDLGHALAGPFAATMLADFGADVLKIERPGAGDPMRRLGPRKDGVPLWWKAAGRNKRSVSLDFTTPRGRELLLELVKSSDVLVENFRPGTLERRGLGWEELREVNPRLVMLRISGFGQTGPYNGRPGFGRTAEAMSGAAQLTGFPEGPPIHVGYSLADTLAGLMGAFGILLSLVGRDRSGKGDCIDLALYEPLFRLIDWQVIVFEQLGIVPTRAGNEFPGVLEGVAAGVGRTLDGTWMSYSAATDSVLERLIRLVLGEDSLREERFASAESRRTNTSTVQAAVSSWIGTQTKEDVERAFKENEAVIGEVFTMETIWNDEGYRARDNIVAVEDGESGTVSMHGVVPRLLERPGEVRWAGATLGEHTEQVLLELANVKADEIPELRRDGVI